MGKTENPFSPGAGCPPPYLAGHREIRESFEGQLESLANRMPKRKAMCLIGPRGCGKTALLRLMEEQAQGAGVRFVNLGAGQMKSSASLAQGLARAVGYREAEETTEIRGGAGLSVPGIGGVEGGGSSTVTRRIGESGTDIKGLLEDALAPGISLLITFDEAHEADPEAARDLIDAYQPLFPTRPILLVMAGTPDLPVAMSRWKATYAERIPRFGVGLIDPKEAKKAIAEPLAGQRISIADSLLEPLAAEAQNYPYFLQIAGKALWNAAPDGQRPRIGKVQAEEARAESAHGKTGLYEDRYDEMERAHLLAPLAELAFEAGEGGRPSREQVKSAIERYDAILAHHGETGGGAPSAEQRLLHVGFAWKHPKEGFLFGIPSLAAYLREHAPKRMADALRDGFGGDSGLVFAVLTEIGGSYVKIDATAEKLAAQCDADPDIFRGIFRKGLGIGILRCDPGSGMVAMTGPILSNRIIAELGPQPPELAPAANDGGSEPDLS